ncbi:MAG: hypothetical protein DRQ48_01870 [Gammaproteobacteria bacterium]|nr:MAG: hypothetical protein DRQ48_01870 [Gammaproteobacteria bacterium]
MIKIIESQLHDQIITSVIDTGRSPPKILSLKKGKFSQHEFNCATYHANQVDQLEIELERASGKCDSIVI